MRAEARTYQNVKLLPQSKGTAAKQLELLNQDYVWEMLTHFDTAGVHYWHADFAINAFLLDVQPLPMTTIEQKHAEVV
ncbi:hypothetical protein PISMIDRAFT_13238 [Pisolithus microcarpus 441]|uniref:Uncharacterized protein n=1 Tax=Pisolithus microcarpus 441 TaxID=765257 RepID=A0A0C9YTP2_9AGAM|nr:hypothetical protein BKA83DRAFT_13238 [Pisolithus microcarpus]KIK20061.1 hypothetical protein PISMIDRAFT_13238 [Pisolithus microcarpus 441]